MTLVPPPKQPEVENDAWADRSDRFALDALLRKVGFRIARRKTGAEALWSKGGVLFWQSEAIKRLTKREYKDVTILMDKYWTKRLQEAESRNGNYTSIGCNL